MSRKKVAIVTDAASDIPPKLVEKYDITILPVMLIFEDKTFKSYGIEKGITWEQFYRLTEEEVPTTAILSPGLFVEAFNEAFTKADSVIGIFISKKLSGVYQSAYNIAKRYFPDRNIMVYHDGVTSVGTATLVLEVAKIAEQGKSFQEMCKKVETLIPYTIYSGIINTLENLVRTGRLSKTKKFFANLLKFKPVLGYEDDEVTIFGQIRANDQIIIERMKQFGEKALEHSYPQATYFFVNHSRWPEAAKKIASHLRDYNQNENRKIIIQETGTINAYFTGKKLLTLGYLGDFDPQWILEKN
jgi:DegV family protein with EDD domain